MHWAFKVLTHKYQMQVLEQLLAENDSVAEAWYLLALAHYGGGAFHDAAVALQEGRALLRRRGGGAGVGGGAQGVSQEGCGDGEGDEVKEMFAELQERIEEGLELDVGGDAEA